MRYECDFVIQSDSGEITVGEGLAFEAPDLACAIKWLDQKLGRGQTVFNMASAVRLRREGKVVWLKVLGAHSAPR